MTLVDLNSVPPPDLKGKPLQTSLKRKLVEETHRKGSNYEIVMEKYNLGYEALRKYYKRVHRGLPVFETGGRPAKLDSESLQSIHIFMHQNAGFAKMDIHALIRAEVPKTMGRRYPGGIPSTASQKVSKSGVRRWAQLLISSHANRHAPSSSASATEIL